MLDQSGALSPPPFPALTWVEMTRPHFQSGRPGPIRAVVIHATAGRAPADLGWLRQGGDLRRPVSCHYYIDKAGAISQLVRDLDTAWHAGVSRWTLDGRSVNGLNAASVGIELENLNNGRDPYPEAQRAAALALTRALVARYVIPRNQLVRHLDISPGRKTDPAGFAWPSFVAQVYAELASNEPPTNQLRALLLDQAYRAAEGALPVAWPLLEAARQRQLGMPVAILAGPQPQGGSAPPDQERALVLPGHAPMLVEVYARDLIYAPATSDGSSALRGQERRLAETNAGPLRTNLLDLLFRRADPTSGFRPDWAFHQAYLAHAASLGVPLGPNHRLSLNAQQRFTCQHFALDSLCSPVGAWQTVYRLSGLAAAPPDDLDAATAQALRQALLDDLYRARTGRRYAAAVLLVRYAEQHGLGAPLGPAEPVVVADQAYLLQPYALDVLAAHLPTADWAIDQPLPASTPITSLRELWRTSPANGPGGVRAFSIGLKSLAARAKPAFVGDPSHAGRPRTASRGVYADRRMAHAVHASDPNDDEPAEAMQPLLGPLSPQPSVFDVRLPQAGRQPRPGLVPDAVVIVPAPGPAALDLRDEAQLGRWHYYLDLSGAIYRLCDESVLAGAAGGGVLGQRAVVIAVEGGPAAQHPVQHTALRWLVRALAAALHLPPAAIRVGL